MAADRSQLGDWSAGLPDEWALGCIDLVEGAPARGWRSDAWAIIQADTLAAIETGWLAQAATAGWDALDVFGVALRAPAERLDLMGLLPALAGVRVERIDSHAAALRTASGAVQVWDRRMVGQEPRALLWAPAAPLRALAHDPPRALVELPGPSAPAAAMTEQAPRARRGKRR